MKIRIASLCLPVIMIPLLFSCVSQNELVRYSPADGSGIWIDGKEYSEAVQNRIRVGITFEEIKDNNLVFNLSVVNKSKSDFLFDPAEMVCLPQKNIPAGNSTIKVENGIRAVDPEDMIYRVKKKISIENDSYQSDQAMNVAAGCAGSAGMIVAKDKQSFDDAEDLSDDADDDYNRRERLHNIRIKKFNEEIEYIKTESFRKNTILPGKSKEGRVFLPVKKDMDNIVIKIPVRDDFVEFTFIKSVLIDNSNARRNRDLFIIN